MISKEKRLEMHKSTELHDGFYAINSVPAEYLERDWVPRMEYLRVTLSLD
jgi:hypothetical protein